MNSRRTCIGCRQRQTKGELVRWSLSPSLEVQVDLEGKRPGRGGYLCPSPACWRQALRGARLSKVFRQPIPAPSPHELVQQLLHQGDRQIGLLLHAAQGAGQVISGRKALLESLEAGQVQLLLMAEDIAEALQGEYRDLCRRKGVPDRLLPWDKGALGGLVGAGWRSALGMTTSDFTPKVERLLEWRENFQRTAMEETSSIGTKGK